MLGDIVAVARNRVNGTRGPAESTYAELPVLPMADTITRYHVAPDANLAATVEALSQLDIVRSIASVLRVEGGV